MPRYHYECTKCGHAYRLVEGWDAKPQKRCPECRSKAIRIPKAPVIIFKGKGFYASDNRSSSFKNRRDEEEGGSTEGGDSSEGTGESGSSDGASSDGASKDESSSSSNKETAPSAGD
ncbi:MAG TPA: FmdB family zinc ribbon protein [Dehalococcoidia bacterium]|nr:FmdB family zinc ribbon protein [Dehalococcoidia bacterium]